MSKWSNFTIDELEHFKSIFFDDWNFGSGKQESLVALDEIEKCLDDLAKTLGGVVGFMHGSSRPPTAADGDTYYDHTTGTFFIWVGKTWIDMVA